MSRLKEVQYSQNNLNSIDYISAEYATSWHLSDISITLGMLYDLLNGTINKEIHVNKDGISVVSCSEVKYENNE